MKAFFLTTCWVEVDTADEAADIAVECDKAGLINAEAVLERRGAEWDDLTGRVGFLGTSFWIIDEDRVA